MKLQILLLLFFYFVRQSRPFFFDLGSLGGCSCGSSCSPPAPMMGCQLLCPPSPPTSGCQQSVASVPTPSYSFNPVYNPYPAPPLPTYQPSLNYNPPIQTLPPSPPPPPLTPLAPMAPPVQQFPASAYQIPQPNQYGRSMIQQGTSYIAPPSRVNVDNAAQRSYNPNNLLLDHFNQNSNPTKNVNQISLRPPVTTGGYYKDNNLNSNSVTQPYQNTYTSSSESNHQASHSTSEKEVQPSSTRNFEETYDDEELDDEHPQIVNAKKAETFSTQSTSSHLENLGEYPISAIAEVKTTEIQVNPVKDYNTNSVETDMWENTDQVTTDSQSTTFYESSTQTAKYIHETTGGNNEQFEYQLANTKSENSNFPTTVAAVYTSSGTEAPETTYKEAPKGQEDEEYEDYETVDEVEQNSKSGPQDEKEEDYQETDSNYDKKREREISFDLKPDMNVEQNEDSFEMLQPDNSSPSSLIKITTNMTTTLPPPPTTTKSTTTTTTTTVVPETTLYYTSTTISSMPLTTSRVPFLFKRARDLSHYTAKQKADDPGTISKCNNEKLKEIMARKMSRNAAASKQAIFSSAARLFSDQTLNVICSCHSFSYIVVTSPIYCEFRKKPLTCFAFVTP